MNARGETDPRESAEEALRRADWNVLLPRLLRGARRYLRVLGWAERDWERPSVLEERELVNEAVKSCLDGTRRWAAGTRATEESLVAFLCATMRSIATNRRTSAAVDRRAGGDALDQQMDERPSASRRFVNQSLLARIEQTFEGDDEALAVCRVLSENDENEPRETIARSLGWSVEYLKTVRKRMSYRLKSQRITLNDDREAEPPSSSPRRRIHEDSAPVAGRREAPGEPDRGARLAGRRR